MKGALIAVLLFVAGSSVSCRRTPLQYGESTGFRYTVNSGNGYYSGNQGVYQTGGGTYAHQGLVDAGAASFGGQSGSSASGPSSSSSSGGSSSGGSSSGSSSTADDWGVASGSGSSSAPASAPSGPPFSIPVQPQIDGYVLGMGLQMKDKWDFPCPHESLSTAKGSDGTGECKLAGTPGEIAAMCSAHSICKGFVYFPEGQSYNHTAVAWMKGGTSPRDGAFDPTKVDLNPYSAIYVKKSAIPSSSGGSGSSGSGSGSGGSATSGSSGSGSGSNGSNSGSGSGSDGSGSGSSGSGSGSSGSGGSSSSGDSSGSSGASGSGGGGDSWGTGQ